LEEEEEEREEEEKGWEICRMINRDLKAETRLL